MPHFEKMSYDNSELLKNFLHGYQVAREPFLREIAEGIIDWTNTVLSDQALGGFYASQDADQTLDDDGDYFTWTQEEVRAVLTPEESRVIELAYDVEPRGEMHHNPAKNVLWIARSIADMARRLAGGHGRRSQDPGAREGKAAGGARGASHAVRGHDALRGMERDVCFGVSRCRGSAGRRQGRGVPRVCAEDARSHVE